MCGNPECDWEIDQEELLELMDSATIEYDGMAITFNCESIDCEGCGKEWSVTIYANVHSFDLNGGA